jgi:hypothetical protein
MRVCVWELVWGDIIDNVELVCAPFCCNGFDGSINLEGLGMIWGLARSTKRRRPRSR